MAKKEVEEAKVQAQEAEVAEGTQEGTQQPANGGGEAPAEQQPKPNKQPKKAEVAEGVKKVKIHTTADVDAIIAGIPYVIAENKDAQVPADVAAILVNARKAYRI
jgi:hypothetical protein